MRASRPEFLTFLLLLVLVGLHTCAGNRFLAQAATGDQEDPSQPGGNASPYCDNFNMREAETCSAQILENSSDLAVMTPYEASSVSREQMRTVRRMWSMLEQLAPSNHYASGGNPAPAVLYRNFVSGLVSRCDLDSKCDCATQNYTILVPPDSELLEVARRLDTGIDSPTEVLFELMLHIIPSRLTREDLTSVSSGLVQTLAGVGLSGVNLRVTHNPPDDVTLSYADIDASIEIADVETCHSGSVMHFVSQMLRPVEMPEQYMDWIDGTGDIWNNTAQSQLQRNSTMLMSILLVLCVVGLLFGVFWGRRKLNINSERLAAQRTRRAMESAHGRMLGFSVKGQERAPLVAVFEPKNLHRVGPMLWAINPPPKHPEPSEDTFVEASVEPSEATDDAAPAPDSEAALQLQDTQGQGTSSAASEPQDLAAGPHSMGTDAQDIVAGTSAEASGATDSDSQPDLACTCVICFDEPGSHVLLPCGHGGYCSSCARTLLSLPLPSRLCPVCRTGLKSIADVSLDTPIGGVSKVLRGFGARGMADATCTVDSVDSGHILPQPSAHIGDESNRASQSSDRESDSLQVVVQLAAAEGHDINREAGNEGGVIVGLSTVLRDDVTLRDDDDDRNGERDVELRPPASHLLNIPIQNVNVSDPLFESGGYGP